MEVYRGHCSLTCLVPIVRNFFFFISFVFLASFFLFYMGTVRLSNYSFEPVLPNEHGRGLPSNTLSAPESSILLDKLLKGIRRANDELKNESETNTFDRFRARMKRFACWHSCFGEFTKQKKVKQSSIPTISSLTQSLSEALKQENLKAKTSKVQVKDLETMVNDLGDGGEEKLREKRTISKTWNATPSSDNFQSAGDVNRNKKGFTFAILATQQEEAVVDFPIENKTSTVLADKDNDGDEGKEPDTIQIKPLIIQSQMHINAEEFEETTSTTQQPKEPTIDLRIPNRTDTDQRKKLDNFQSKASPLIIQNRMNISEKEFAVATPATQQTTEAPTNHFHLPIANKNSLSLWKEAEGKDVDEGKKPDNFQLKTLVVQKREKVTAKEFAHNTSIQEPGELLVDSSIVNKNSTNSLKKSKDDDEGKEHHNFQREEELTTPKTLKKTQHPQEPALDKNVTALSMEMDAMRKELANLRLLVRVFQARVNISEMGFTTLTSDDSEDSEDSAESEETTSQPIIKKSNPSTPSDNFELKTGVTQTSVNADGTEFATPTTLQTEEPFFDSSITNQNPITLSKINKDDARGKVEENLQLPVGMLQSNGNARTMELIISAAQPAEDPASQSEVGSTISADDFQLTAGVIRAMANVNAKEVIATLATQRPKESASDLSILSEKSKNEDEGKEADNFQLTPQVFQPIIHFDAVEISISSTTLQPEEAVSQPQPVEKKDDPMVPPDNVHLKAGVIQTRVNVSDIEFITVKTQPLIAQRYWTKQLNESYDGDMGKEEGESGEDSEGSSESYESSEEKGSGSESGSEEEYSGSSESENDKTEWVLVG